MPPIVKRNVEWIELIISILVLLGMIVTTWVSVNNRLAILETKQENDEGFKLEMRGYFKELSKGQTEILVKLQDKEDKETK